MASATAGGLDYNRFAGTNRERLAALALVSSRSAWSTGLIVLLQRNDAIAPRSTPAAARVSKGRLEAFSDGVIAIIITIMVLELRAPHGAEPAALRSVLPAFLSYTLSFVLVGIYWNNHHHLRRLRTASHWSPVSGAQSRRTGKRLPSEPCTNGSGNEPTTAGTRIAALQSR